MDECIDKIIVTGFGFFLLLEHTTGYQAVIAFLAAVTIASLGIYAKGTKYLPHLLLAICPIAYLFSPILFFFPVFLYDIVYAVKWADSCGRTRLAIAAPYISGAILLLLFLRDTPKKPEALMFWALASGLAVLLAVRTGQKRMLSEKLIHIRDSGVELNRMLEEKNQQLLEKQDYEIHLATLRERNRIAREIHDNVGHMLSRSLLLTGALLTVEKEGAVHEQLSYIRETLDSAMAHIRRSVHDLHEDSIDVKASLEELLEPLQKDYAVVLDYDMGEEAPRQVKYALIAITKEALSNTIKHSDAGRIWVRVREHPGFYQLSVEDDGTPAQTAAGNGLGLLNMKERADALGGTFRVHTQTGFQVFVTIPKTEEMRCR